MLLAMQRMIVALALLLGACGGNPNPPVPPPSSTELAGGGVWVAYNLGCTAGCDKIRRGDRILAIDGVAVTNGAEFDAANLARGTAVDVRVAKYDGSGKVDVQVVASPHTDMPPLKAVPPLLTVGAAALDRDIRRGEEAGFYRYLTKPVQVDTLIATLEQLLDGPPRP